MGCGLRIKNFNIMAFTEKIKREKGLKKKLIYREDCLKRGTWTVCSIRVGLARKSGDFFEKWVGDSMQIIIASLFSFPNCCLILALTGRGIGCPVIGNAALLALFNEKIWSYKEKMNNVGSS